MEILLNEERSRKLIELALPELIRIAKEEAAEKELQEKKEVDK